MTKVFASSLQVAIMCAASPVSFTSCVYSCTITWRSLLHLCSAPLAPCTPSTAQRSEHQEPRSVPRVVHRETRDHQGWRCRKVDSNFLLSAINSISLARMFQYMVWFENFATAPASPRAAEQEERGEGWLWSITVSTTLLLSKENL